MFSFTSDGVPQVKNHLLPTENEVGWALGPSRRCAEQKNISSLRGIEPQLLWVCPCVG